MINIVQSQLKIRGSLNAVTIIYIKIYVFKRIDRLGQMRCINHIFFNNHYPKQTAPPGP